MARGRSGGKVWRRQGGQEEDPEALFISSCGLAKAKIWKGEGGIGQFEKNKLNLFVLSHPWKKKAGEDSEGHLSLGRGKKRK